MTQQESILQNVYPAILLKKEAGKRNYKRLGFFITGFILSTFYEKQFRLFKSGCNFDPGVSPVFVE